MELLRYIWYILGYLCEKIWKHVESVEFALHLRILSALAFALTQNFEAGFYAPMILIRKVYNGMVSWKAWKIHSSHDFEEMLHTWKVSHQLGKMSQRTNDELPRTSNCVTLFFILFWRFLNVLNKEEFLVSVPIFHHLANHQLLPSNWIYLKCNLRVLHIVDDFQIIK